jgi:hypothetical protein
VSDAGAAPARLYSPPSLEAHRLDGQVVVLPVIGWQQKQLFDQAAMPLGPFGHAFVGQRGLQPLLLPPRFPSQFGFRPAQLGTAAKVLDVVTGDGRSRHGNPPL